VAQEDRGDREDSRAASDVDDAAELLLEEELEAEARRRVRARPERASWIDDDGDGSGRRRLPGRPDPEWADLDGVVELAPPIFPTVGDLGYERAGESGEHPFGAGPVGRELDGLDALRFLEALGRELDEPRS
jgi:hypothetical protein